MIHKLEEDDWKLLLSKISEGKCTPFLGAGASHPTIRLAADIARKWAEEEGYPLEGSASDLIKVSQYIAVMQDAPTVRTKMLKELQVDKPPDFSASDEPHGVLADLPLPVYVTTNYDDFMVQALISRNRPPHREFCRWNRDLRESPSVFDSKDFTPTPEKPVVFHLHGHNQWPDSLLITEDDYLDFLVNVWEDRETSLPLPIREALSRSSLLFIGYGLADYNFRVIFRGLVTSRPSSLRPVSVAVQLAPKKVGDGDLPDEKMRTYFERYYSGNSIRAYWGTAREFAAELKQRWEDHKKP